MRLDEFVSEKLNISRSKAKGIIEDGFVIVNGVIKKASYKLKEGDDVKINYIQTKPVIKSRIIYEDDELFAVDKAPEDVYSIAEFYSYKVIDALDNGIVHRLDRFTTGIMIFAKRLNVQEFLKNEFKSRNVKKTYIAITEAGYPAKSGVIKAKIANYRGKTSVQPFGKESYSSFKVLTQKNGIAVVAVNPVTGRTHQVRAHLSFLGKPVCGDFKYGSRIKAPRYMLHSYMIKFKTPSKVHTFRSPVPGDFKIFLKNYGISNLRLPQ